MGGETFSLAAVAAFPFGYRSAAEDAAEALKPFVDVSYRQAFVDARVFGQPVSVPNRIHFSRLELPHAEDRDQRWLAIQCLCTRSTNGYLRQRALRAIVNSTDPAAIPFIALLAGEYVVEIIDDILLALPAMDHDSYATFVRENRQLMQRIRAQATSYWNCYYRGRFPERGKYPGLAFLDEVERWAA